MKTAAAAHPGRLRHRRRRTDCRQVLRTYEWSRLEPGVMSLRLYAPGVGIVRERDIVGGSEVFELVSVKHG